MKASINLTKLLVIAVAAMSFTITAVAQEEFVRFARATCSPALHCPDRDCPGAVVINPGPVVEMKTRRTYFLDYPCDLKKGEKVTFILSLHGGGSYANWQRHYFPIMDFKDKYRLVIATPSSPTQVWGTEDDGYLQNVVTSIIDQLGKENIKAFWLVGHSQGGMTSHRIVRTDFFKDKVDGWLSLSGGRLGGSPGRPANSAPGGAGAAASGAGAPGGGGRPGATGANSPMAATLAALRELPAADFSHIYTTGQHEMDEKGIPEASDWAKKYSCGPQRKGEEIVDARAGYVYDSTRLNGLRKSWGLLPGPGKAQVYVYPDCKDGRVVADVVRIDKGHTEGLEPNVTEGLIKLMLSAKGGKLQQASATAAAPPEKR